MGYPEFANYDATNSIAIQALSNKIDGLEYPVIHMAMDKTADISVPANKVPIDVITINGPIQVVEVAYCNSGGANDITAELVLDGVVMRPAIYVGASVFSVFTPAVSNGAPTGTLTPCVITTRLDKKAAESLVLRLVSDNAAVTLNSMTYRIVYRALT